MIKKAKQSIELSETILINKTNENQALVKTAKKNKKEKISIECNSTEKLSLLSFGTDSIEKAAFGCKADNDDEKILVSEDPLSENKKKKGTAKTKTQTIQQIIKGNQESKITSTFSDKHFAIVFDGAKLLTPNVIFSALQYHKYDVFSYKKSWHTIISRELERLHAEFLRGKRNCDLPFFQDSVQVIIFRSAPTLVDEDAVVIMFKYIIDALKKDKKNPFGVLADDNPKIIFKSESFNEKGSNLVGIRLEYIPEAEKEVCSADKILYGL